MQSGQMKIVKDGDTVHVMPEMKQIGEDFNQFTREADETIAKLKKKSRKKIKPTTLILVAIIILLALF